MAIRQITVALLNNLRTGFKTDFQRGIDKVQPTFLKFSTKVNSSTKIETYGWLGDFPRFRKWVGAKVVKRMAEKAYKLLNEPFEVTRGIKKHDIEDDNLGLWGPMIEGWGEEAQALPDRLAYDALAKGHLNECYDGQNFFDDEHPMAGAVVSNMSAAGPSQPWYVLVTGKSLKPILIQEREKPHFHMVTEMTDSEIFKTGEFLVGGEARYGAGYTYWQLAYRSTLDLTPANYEAAQSAIMALTDDEGEPLELKGDLVVAGRSNRVKLKQLFDAMLITGGESNIYYKDVEYLVSQRLP
jgi:phage major head subunit gpT-like protein